MATEIQTSTVNAIGKCSKCKTVRRVTVDVTRYIDVTYRDGRRFDNSRNTYSLDGANVVCWNGRLSIRCNAGHDVMATPVRGRLSEKLCNAKCTGATGFDCECECAGYNHGAAHA